MSPVSTRISTASDCTRETHESSTWKNAGPFGPGVVASARSRQSPSRGEQLPANRCATWEELHTGRRQRIATMRSRAGPDNPDARMPAMRSAWPHEKNMATSRNSPRKNTVKMLRLVIGRATAHAADSEIPALRLRNQEIAEHLNACHRFELFRIDEIRL